MKKILSLIFVALLPIVANAETVEIDGIYYNLITKVKVAEVTSNPNYYFDDVIIPESVTYNGKTYSVTSIGDHAFAGPFLTSVTIPNSVTSIGEYAFHYCGSLTSITIPGSVTSISDFTFYGSSGLTSITIPNSVTSIGICAFSGCINLTSITIPGNVTSIGSNAFGECGNLTSVHITDLSAWCKIKFDDFEANPLGHAHHLYLNGDEIKGLVSPNDVTSIGEEAFYGCTSLTSVTIPNSVTSIGNEAFHGCINLSSIIIGSGIDTINEKTFANCPELTDVYCYAENVPITEANAFDGSYIDHATLHVPASAINHYKAISPWSSFETILGLMSSSPVILFADANVKALCVANWDSNNDGELSEDEAAAVTSLGDVFKNRPDITSFDELRYFVGLTSIEDEVFYGCNNMASITIPDNVTHIGNYSFMGCNSLSYIAIPDNTIFLGSFAFNSCSRLSSIIIPNSVPFIGQATFSGCTGLISATIGNSVTRIDEEAFKGCSCLQTIDIPNSVTYLGERVFEDCTSIISASIGNGVTSISNFAFQNCSNLASVTIGNNVSSIGNDAFYNCSCLASVTIPNSVTSIGSSAFQNCTGLTSLVIPSSVQTIGYGAFSGCCLKFLETHYKELNYDIISLDSNLENLIIGAEVETIDNTFGLLDNCYNLSSIIVENGNTKYDSRNNCNALIQTSTNTLMKGCCNTIIPDDVTIIDEKAFWQCKGITTVNIPDGVTTINRVAFQACSDLTTITIGKNVSFISAGAFAICPNLTTITVASENQTYDSRNNCNAIIYKSRKAILVGCKNTIIPDDVTEIAPVAFAGCSGLNTITIPNNVTDIDDSAFDYCSGLTSITFGSGVTTILDLAFRECTSLTEVYCLAENVPNTKTNAFQDSPIGNATLYVPAASVSLYQGTEPWSSFGTIVPIGDIPEPEKCATPTISYANGKLTFSSETEGAECVATISDTDIKTHYGNEILLTATYTITVYATKDGYENSEVATGTLCWIDVAPQTEGIVNEDAVMEVKAMPVLIQSQGGTISIQGAVEGTPIAVYDIEGKQYGSTIAEKDYATITTSLRPGSIAVVKIGEKAVKVLLK